MGRINRNIVECKSSLNISGVDFSISINRNIVECKYHERREVFIRIMVLIETLWNVNRLTRNQVRGRSTVLIETLWNVNIEAGCFTYCPDSTY